MTKTIVNLTLQVLVGEIENILETYPHYPYQQAFAITELRQELIAYVLNRTSSCYAVVDEQKQQSIGFNCLPYSKEERLCIQTLIREGIKQIIQQNSEEVSHQIPPEIESAYAPSHWFG
ncbi:hypothetical protein [Nostoc sp. JL23]|uniref:hypothetical protein n=1 Tax=Nostoc sp. JL23 TaxID=2815394 RepID=UPI001D67EE40|nr:hypothetical protein [Nostoc sp. JL23]MBN3880055.1 hypothetical protein [Nostoc sp. JL23]